MSAYHAYQPHASSRSEDYTYCTVTFFTCSNSKMSMDNYKTQQTRVDINAC